MQNNDVTAATSSNAADNQAIGQLTRNNDGVVSNNMTELEANIAPVTSGRSMDNKAINDGTRQELRTLLERPTLIDTIQIEPTTSFATSLPRSYNSATYQTYVAGTQPQGTLARYAFPQSVFDKNPIVADKAENFRYMKADVVVTIKVNASPFTSGALNIAYTPMWNELVDIFKYSNITLAGVTSYPNATLCLDQADSVELRVPFILPYDMFSLHDPNFQFGQVLLSQLTPVRNGDGTNVDINVFARFENVDIALPTNELINPSPSFPLTRMDRYAQSLEQIDLDVPGNKSRLKDIIGRLKLMAQAGSAETETKGIVERVSGGVGAAAEILSSVPYVNIAAKPIGWIARATEHVASLFGWSKPVSTDGIKIMSRVPGYNMVNGEGTETNQSLGLTHDQGILPHGALFEKEDEMSLSYVLSRPNCVEQATWSAPQTTGTKVCDIRVCPRLINSSGGLPQTVQLGSFDYASNLFQKWSGGINLAMTLVKTKFHAGRLAIVYCPGGAPDLLGSLLSTNYNILVDLNEISSSDGTSAQVSMNVPYTLNRPYLDNVRTGEMHLGVYVVNPLKQPTGCADKVDILWWKSAGEDYELAVPGGQFSIANWPSVGLTAQAGFSQISPNQYHLIPGQDKRKYLERAVCAIGEKVESLRTYAKRFGKVAYNGNLITTYPPTKPEILSPRESILLLYRFYYGGIRCKFPLTKDETMEVQYVSTISTKKSTSINPDSIYSNPISIGGQVNNLAEVEIPFFSSTRLRTVGVGETQTTPLAYTMAVRPYLTQGRSFSRFIDPSVDAAFERKTTNFFMTQEQYDAMTSAGGLISNGRGDLFFPEAVYDQTYWEWTYTPPASGGADLKYQFIAYNPTGIFQANGDTAGATFLVAPPCVTRTTLFSTST